MMTDVKKILAVGLLMASFIMPVYADDASTYVHMEVKYSDDITPQEGDEFLITYHEKESGDYEQIEFDASELVGKTGKVELSPADYIITDVAYEGYNKKINSQGYCVTNEFTVTDDPEDYEEFILSIGTNAGTNLMKQYENTIAKKEDEIVKSLEKNDENVSAGNGTEVSDKKYSSVKDVTTDSSTDSDKPESDVEDTKSDSQKINEDIKSSNKLYKMLPLICASIIVAIILFVLKKKGKIN